MELNWKRLLLTVGAMMLAGAAAMHAFADVRISGEHDDREVKYFVRGLATFNRVTDGVHRMSAWDINRTGGDFGGSGGVKLLDKSENLPVDGSRKFEPITYGKVTVDSPISLSTKMPGARMAFMNDDQAIVDYRFGLNQIFLRAADGTETPICSYSENAVFYIRTTLDFDSKMITAVYVNNAKVIENIPFASDAQQANRFYMTTSREGTGSFHLPRLSIHRGYWVNEYFNMGTRIAPQDWTLSKNGQKIEVGKELDNGVEFNGDYVAFKNLTGETSLEKTFEKSSRDQVYEVQLLMPEAHAGAEAYVMDGAKKVFSIVTDQKGYSYRDQNGNLVHFYDAWKNVWYHFRVHTSFETHTAKLYLNERLIADNIPIRQDVNGADKTGISVAAGNDEVWYTGVMLYPEEKFSDYVPEPVKPQKKYDIDIGMQMCPMWTEGFHGGWEAINAAPGRMPLLGMYDEGDEEATDWNIKWMVEHGVDFQWYCWYGLGNPPEPINDTDSSPALNGIRRAKYNDQIKFAIMFENAGVPVFDGKTAEERRDLFFNSILPFWIEHYFKHPSYYKINGRPVVGVYYFWKIVDLFGSDSTVLDEMRSVCEEAGVGNPIFVQQYTAYDTADIAQIASWGTDAVYTYAFGPTRWRDQIEFHRIGDENLKKYGVSYIPIIAPGYDVYAWDQSMGVLWSKQEMKEGLSEMFSHYWEDTGANIDGKKILMLGSWDEYGEGHYIAPTQYTGFNYLDALYETLIDENGCPKNEVPNEHQKDRFNNWYPYDRVVPVHEGIQRDEIPAEHYVKYAWNFDEEEPDWKVMGGIETAKTENGSLVLTPNKEEMKLSLTRKDLNISDVKFIKIRLKNEAKINEAVLIPSVKPDPKYTDYKVFKRGVSLESEQYQDIIFDTGMYSSWWRGTLSNMNLSLRFVRGEGDVLIDSIEMYAENPEKQTLLLDFDGIRQEAQAVMIDDMPLIPLRKLSELQAGSIYWDAERKAAYYNNGKEQAILERPRCTDTGTDAYYGKIIDGVIYLPRQTLSVLTGMDVCWDEEARTLSVMPYDDFVLTRPASERKQFYEMKFNSEESLNSCLIYSIDTKIENGVLKMQYEAGDPILYSPYFSGVDASKVKYIAIGLSSNVSYSGQVFFMTNKSGSASGGKCFGFEVSPSTEIVEYLIDTSKNTEWQDQITRWRFDPGDWVSGETNLAYVRFYGDFESELSEEELALRYDSAEKTEDGVFWEMRINNARDGWICNKNAANIRLEQGMLKILQLTGDTAIYTAGNPDFPGEELSKIKIRMQNETPGTTAKLYYQLEGQNDYPENQSFSINLRANDPVGTLYTIKPDAPISGRITGLKLVPSDQKGKISIDYIRLLK